jgi:hypothetical protein
LFIGHLQVYDPQAEERLAPYVQGLKDFIRLSSHETWRSCGDDHRNKLVRIYY